jgi:hypothetical protein
VRRARGSGRSREAVRGKVRPHDPFELIRWLALSQPDPRKALAELVQNSLDAGARRITVTRIRHGGLPCLRILDDGEGVIPEMTRPEALRYIATHIGHSRKRSLSPEERLRLMTQGQYGIGLLGFWSLGQVLEMRTSIPDQRPHHLILHRDRPDFVIEPLRGRLPLDGRWTEVVVADLHREALSVLGGRRAADYLASELRGQLLARDVDLVVVDRMSRGRSQKINPVRPVRFLGERLEGIGPVPVPGHSPIRFEIYVAAGAEAGTEARGIAVYASGTLVAESFHELGHLGLDHPPWTDARLTGLVDYADFQVTPGSRRGLVPDAAAGAFARAIGTAESILEGLLDGLERRKSEELDRALIRDLQRAFRDFYRQRPRYAMLPVSAEKSPGESPDVAPEATGEAATGGEGGPAEGAIEPGDASGPARDPRDDEASEAPPPPAVDLLPAGPLASVRITPSPLRVECLGTRRARASAVDASGRAVEEPVSFQWRVEGPVGTIETNEGTPETVILRAAAQPAEGALVVTALCGGREAQDRAPVEIVEEIPSRGADEGIPDPELVDQPGASWRSRMLEGRWQVNVGHREYRAIVDQPALKLRYLSMLFAKEIVLRSSQDPRLEQPLEQLVEVAAYADRNIGRRRQGRKRGKGPEPPPRPCGGGEVHEKRRDGADRRG